MCGIAGVLYSDPGRTVEPSVLQQMGEALAHRGPDGEGYFRAGGVGLVHRRLAIIDLAGGQQPVANEDGTVQVVFNGEIYNYRELRTELEQRGHVFRTQSDTEVLVHLYEEHGPALCRRLRGMFAFALWDAGSRQLLLARDHLGQKPLYVYQDREKLVFGSELKALLAHPQVSSPVDPAAVEDYLTWGFVPGDRCILQNIRKLRAGHWLHITLGQPSAVPECYWQLSFEQTAEGSTADWMARVAAALQDSVSAHLVADVPVGAFLSGGLDSSAIVAMASDLRSDPLQTFSVGFQEREFSELPYAAAVARHFGCVHTEEIVTPEAARDLDDLVYLYDEPFADASAIPTMAVARMASRHVKVVLSGDGGDELFGGYSRYAHDLREAEIRQRLPVWFRRTVLRPLAAVWPRVDWLPRPLRLQTVLQNLSLDAPQAYANTVSACRRGLRGWLLNPEFRQQVAGHRPEQLIAEAYTRGARDALSGMLAADISVLLPDDFLTKVDRASMGFGLEVRPPLIDWPLMELAAGMPSELKIQQGSKKWILKELFAARLPQQLAHRPKQGFELPTDAWLRGPLREQVEQVVLHPRSRLAEFIRTDHTRRLFTAHLQGRGRYGQILWSLLILGRWLAAWGSSGGGLQQPQRRGGQTICERSVVS